MKYIFWLLLWLPVTASACDICNLYAGIMPEDYKNSAGMYVRSRLLQGIMKDGEVMSQTVRHGSHVVLPYQANRDTTIQLMERYSTAEFRLRMQFSERFSMLAVVPMITNVRKVGGEITARSFNVGDPVLLGGYQVLNTFAGDTVRARKHRMGVYAGIRFPMGTRLSRYNNQVMDLDMQPGKGAFDAVLMADYVAAWRTWGIQAQANARHSVYAAARYVYGSALNASLAAFMVVKPNTVFSVYPRMGLSAEMAGKDRFRGITEPGTGGGVVFVDWGCDFYYKSFSIGIAYQPAVINRWNNTQLPVTDRFQTQIQIIF
jgi:hypothetical protein